MFDYDTYLFTVDPFFDSKYWGHKTALLLLANIIPNHNTQIVWDSAENIRRTEHGQRRVIIYEAMLLEHFTKPLGDERKQFLERIYYFSENGWNCTDIEIQEAKLLLAQLEYQKNTIKDTQEGLRNLGVTEKPDSLEVNCAKQVLSGHPIKISDTLRQQACERLVEFLQVERSLYRLYECWAEEGLVGNSHTPNDYIQWADEKKFNISWLIFRHKRIASKCTVRLNPTIREQTEQNEEKFRKTSKIVPHRIAELDRQIAKLEEKRRGELTREVEILLTEKQAELSKLFLTENLSIYQVVQLLAWSTEISDYHNNESFHAIDKILTAHFEKVKSTLPIVEKAVLSGELECEIYRNPTDDTSIDRDKSTITRSAVRKWLLKTPGYFSSGFFPEINNSEDWESIRQRMLSEQENNECLREKPGLLTEAVPNAYNELLKSGNTELNDAVGPPPIVGRKLLEAQFEPATWNTIKVWLGAKGISKPPRGEVWTAPWSVCLEIMAEKRDFFQIKRKKIK